MNMYSMSWTRTRSQWFTLHSSSPTPSVLSAWNFEELSRDLDIVWCIIDHLHATFAWIILGPRISLQAVALVASMTRACISHRRVNA